MFQAAHSFLLQEASRSFGLGKDTAFHKTTTDDYLELLKDREFVYAFTLLSCCIVES